VALPSVVLYELEFGLRRSTHPEGRRRQLEQFVRSVTVLPFEEKAARAAAQIRFELERAGAPIGPVDTLIAGTALAWGATLVTRNTREFGRIRGLRTVDWYA
jgi:tRNA(fMet)-specific endonuclease VapC